MTAKAATQLTQGFVEVAVSGTPQQLTTAKQTFECNRIVLQALVGNTGEVTVGSSTVLNGVTTQGANTRKGVGLKKGETLILEVDDPAQVWVDCATAKDGVGWVAELA